jgi:hypothetical protein
VVGAEQDERRYNRLELAAAILMSVATVLIAWSAFQSTKWGGVQANSYAAASAARTESSKASTTAGQLTVIDVGLFTDWLSALADETRIDPNASRLADGTYTPDPTQLSGFLFDRFRDEFKPAVRAWMKRHPFDPAVLDEPQSPFTMKEYVRADADRADRLTRRATLLGARARDANQRGDNYVLTTVLFASVLFFAGISSKFDSLRNRTVMIALAAVFILVGLAVLATFPVEI